MEGILSSKEFTKCRQTGKERREENYENVRRLLNGWTKSRDLKTVGKEKRPKKCQRIRGSKLLLSLLISRRTLQRHRGGKASTGKTKKEARGLTGKCGSYDEVQNKKVHAKQHETNVGPMPTRRDEDDGEEEQADNEPKREGKRTTTTTRTTLRKPTRDRLRNGKSETRPN